MTRDEAEALLIERAGNLCARYYQRHDGTILFADCTVGARRRRRRRWIAAGAVTLLAGGAGLGAALERKPHCESINIQLGPEDGVTWTGEVRADDPAPKPPPPVHRAEVSSGAWTTGVLVVPETDVKRLPDGVRRMSGSRGSSAPRSMPAGDALSLASVRPPGAMPKRALAYSVTNAVEQQHIDPRPLARDATRGRRFRRGSTLAG